MLPQQVGFAVFLARNVRSDEACYAAMHFKLHCVAQKCHVAGVIFQLPNDGHSRSA
jgi:hypothetical protein